MWYTIELNTEPPPAEQELKLNALVRQAIGVDIKLKNPLSYPVDFEVVMIGDGLLGESTFSVGGNEEATY
jgi:hypothetical protein